MSDETEIQRLQTLVKSMEGELIRSREFAATYGQRVDELLQEVAALKISRRPVWKRPLDSESTLFNEARLSISDSNWRVGELASYWMRRLSHGRDDAHFGLVVGLNADQVFQRRRVWEMFYDVREAYPNLLWTHFFAVLSWDDAAEYLRWANDIQATVAEMKAFRRAQTGTALIKEPTP